jgi:predicted  nucleic acid-binding Zn-ribbon protein
MKSKLIAGSLLASALFAGVGMSPVMAQSTNTPGIDRAQQEIGARIQQGLASGHITPSEAQSLYRREREIQFRESRFKSDGSASPQERQQLRQDLDALRDEVERNIANPRVDAQQPDNTPGIDNREFRIRDRIEEGVRSGRITEREASRLHRREREIERHEARFKSDGTVTREERRELRDELTALRDDVERMMRNDRRGRYDR